MAPAMDWALAMVTDSLLGSESASSLATGWHWALDSATGSAMLYPSVAEKVGVPGLDLVMLEVDLPTMLIVQTHHQ